MASIYTGAVTAIAMTDMTWTYRLDCTHAVWQHATATQSAGMCTDKIRCYATSITEGDTRVVLPPGLATRHLWLLLYPCGTSTGTTT